MKLDRAALRAHPLPPVIDGEKGSKGRILVIAGSREVPGAALLTASATMRAFLAREIADEIPALLPR
ncbi:MAG: hypothetical protein V4499_09555 [Pseudomonadota bacterium]